MPPAVATYLFGAISRDMSVQPAPSALDVASTGAVLSPWHLLRRIIRLLGIRPFWCLFVLETQSTPQPLNARDMPNHGMMLKSWLKYSMPFVLWRCEDCMTIIHSIEPYHKRAREEA